MALIVHEKIRQRFHVEIVMDTTMPVQRHEKQMFIIKYLHKYTCNTIAHHKQEGRTEIVMKTTTCNKTWLTCKHL